MFVEYDFMVQKPLKSYIIRLLGKSPRSEALSKRLMQRDDGSHRRRQQPHGWYDGSGRCRNRRGFEVSFLRPQ